MTTSEVAEHYDNFLGARYDWMLGDFDQAVTDQMEVLGGLVGEASDPSQMALDLGCGTGVHTLALAGLGYGNVLALDVSARMLEALQTRALGRSSTIKTVQADIASGLADVVAQGTLAVITCMGDTLPHLPDRAAVSRMLAYVHDALAPSGWLVLSFRDLSAPPSGLDRFIPVHADEANIMTCFLEDEDTHVRVHDLIHRREPQAGWALEKSSYRKLKLEVHEVVRLLQDAEFVVRSQALGPRGMWVISAQSDPHLGSGMSSAL